MVPNKSFQLVNSLIILKMEKDKGNPMGIDEDTATVGDALAVIKFLLKNDESVKGYKLVKKV